MSKALNHTTVPQNMSQKNLTAKTNGTTVTAKNVTKPSALNNSEKVNVTLPQKNISKVAVPSVSDSNKFAKQNPFGDFSGFERTVDQMEPLVADL